MGFWKTASIMGAGLLLALSVSPASAEKRVALTIGIDAYQNLNAEQQLRRAVNDSRSVGAALTAVGFEVIVGEDLQRLDFNRIWQRFLNRIEPGDTVAFFFAGHGVEIAGLNFLLARDVPKVAAGEEDLLKGEAIGVSRLLDDLRARQPKVSLLILDACRNNPFQQEGGRSVGGSRGLARIEAPEGTFVMFSAGTGEAALDRLADNDGAANSIYTRRLVPLLTQPGLTLPDLAQEVRRQVRDLAASVKHRQTPAYYDEIVGRFCLASCGGRKTAGPGRRGGFRPDRATASARGHTENRRARSGIADRSAGPSRRAAHHRDRSVLRQRTAGAGGIAHHRLDRHVGDGRRLHADQQLQRRNDEHLAPSRSHPVGTQAEPVRQ